jgi:hypothetical protein
MKKILGCFLLLLLGLISACKNSPNDSTSSIIPPPEPELQQTQILSNDNNPPDKADSEDDYNLLIGDFVNIYSALKS